MADFSMIPIHVSIANVRELTFDPRFAGPLHRRGDQHSSRVGACPCETCPCLDAENTATGHIGSTRRGEHRNVLIKIAVFLLIRNMAFCLLGTNGPVQRLDVGNGTG